MYQGAIVLENASKSMVVPVTVAVAARAQQDAQGNLVGSTVFGGEDVAAAQDDLTYSNGSVFGATDWTWRPESGDWRFFFLDVPVTPAAGSLFLAMTEWEDAAPYTDVDTLVFGPSPVPPYQVTGSTAPFGQPYPLATVGGSPNTNIGGGVWTFDTATGGAADLVTAPVKSGLHEFVWHQVNFNGGKFNVPVKTTVAGASVNPSSVQQTTTTGSGSFDVTFKAGLDLPGLVAEGFGLSQPSTTTETARQDNPDDPSSASVKRSFTVSHASRAVITSALSQDLDMFVVYDADKDGSFESNEIVASSAGATGDERVELVRPPDGNYQVWMLGFAISGTPTFPLTIDVVQGNDLNVTVSPSGAIPAGTPVTIHVTYSKTMTDGKWFGDLLLGPPAAPAAITVPIEITKTS
jgi:hypothetical protein